MTNNSGKVEQYNNLVPQEFDALRQHWFVICRESELSNRPFSRTLLSVPLVIFRDQDKVVALLDRCPHRNAPLSSGVVIDGCVQCPYHGWKFGAQGECVLQPGVESSVEDVSIPSFQTITRNGLVWACLDSKPNTEPVARSWECDSDFKSFTFVDSVESAYVDAIENLLDATHTPFVHSGLVRCQSEQQTFSAIVRVRHEVVEAEYLNEGKQAGWISRLFERDRASSFGRFIPPCLAELEYTSKRGTEFVLNSYFTPESTKSQRVYSTIYLRQSMIPISLKRFIVMPFFRNVLKQDQRILRLQKQNIQRFGRTDYHSWKGDLLRGWIDTWMKTGHLPESENDHHVDFQL